MTLRHAPATRLAMAARLYVHLTWTTLNRLPLITTSVQAFLDGFLRHQASRHQAIVLAGGMVTDHVHLVVEVQPVFDLPALLQAPAGIEGGELTGRQPRWPCVEAPPSMERWIRRPHHRRESATIRHSVRGNSVQSPPRSRHRRRLGRARPSGRDRAESGLQPAGTRRGGLPGPSHFAPPLSTLAT
jgi:REP element-mobilizing transposase RayT